MKGDQLVAAEVVGATLHVADPERTKEGFQEGDVAEKELVLQSLGAGGDDDTLAGAQGRQKVRKGFAGAGTGLDDQVPALFQGAFHSLCHLELPWAVLIRQGRLRENASGRKELAQRGQGSGCGVGRGHGG